MGETDLGVFVVGMHRTGTSAITRVVNLLGVPIGSEDGLKPASPGNPTGYWEVGALTTFNEHLLGELGGTWQAPPLLSGAWTEDNRLQPLRERARETFYRFHKTQQWVWKDPRNAIVLPFWLDVLDVRPVVVVVCRHPLEVAESLASRDGLSKRLAVALWERYLRQALVAADRLPVLVARYADILSAPEAWRALAREFLSSQGVDCSRAASEDETTRFLDPDLRHTEFAPEDVATEPIFSDAQRELFATVESLAPAYERFDLSPLPEETPWTETLLAERRVTRAALLAQRKRRTEAKRATLTSPGGYASSPALQRRLKKLRASSAFKNYERVRSHVMQMPLDQRADKEIGAPSAYAAEELARIEYMLDASPLIVDKLREHCHHVTGVGPQDYGANDPEVKSKVRRKLRALAGAGQGGLVVPEPKLLGGFGADVRGDLYNADSLGYSESLVAMAHGSILTHPGKRGEPLTVWEIGAGWGGFAYQFKRLFPKVTYVISDFPARFLLSGTYLMTAFPKASFAFYEGDDDIDWGEQGFVFIPNTALEAVCPPQVDLTISIRSFEEMTTAQVDSYVAHAYERGCPYLYSFGRDRAPGNVDLDSAHDVVARYFWPHEVVVPSPKSRVGDRATGRVDGSVARYQHVIGWRRLKI